MDIEALFSGKLQSPDEENQGDIKIAVIDSFTADPLIYGIGKEFSITRENPLKCAVKLTEGMVNSAIIATLDYAKGKGSWKLIPDICIAVKGSFETINLFFKKEIRDLKTITVDSNDPTAIALLKIIMQEKYGISPELVYKNGSLSEKLDSTDAALLSGNDAFNLQKSNKVFIDLSEDWIDLTGLPFVYALWAVHELGFNPAVVEKLKFLADYNLKNQDRILKLVFEKYAEDVFTYTDFIQNSISYYLGLEEKEAINEFFRYAFFYGMIEHIPDLHFCD